MGPLTALAARGAPGLRGGRPVCALHPSVRRRLRASASGRGWPSSAGVSHQGGQLTQSRRTAMDIGLTYALGTTSEPADGLVTSRARRLPLAPAPRSARRGGAGAARRAARSAPCCSSPSQLVSTAVARRARQTSSRSPGRRSTASSRAAPHPRSRSRARHRAAGVSRAPDRRAARSGPPDRSTRWPTAIVASSRRSSSS